jgi:hypothetical protein
LGKAVRVVDVDAVPPLATMDDAVTVSAWLFKLGVSGQLDPATTREANRSVTTFVHATDKAELLRRVRALERKLKAYESTTKTVTR